ncbi:hypothetical protein EV137_0054 [Kribbella pratensis]|uniref:Short subunit dehydrogenase n=1 Tax=Kribbella pratensis TaxID=2512112 RepID=A0ABY2FI44_9ACTN|nr:hypothetical protein [Kribbella pratensis]TDW92794.1 hypothetical protein EV137_0054 [Kribbella pratensis]
MGAWSDADINDQGGRTVVITGANSGLGLRAATVLAACLDSVRKAAADIREATAPDVQGGDYYGPQKFGEFFGGVGPARIDPRAQDQKLRARLWERTAELTGVPPDPAYDHPAGATDDPPQALGGRCRSDEC